MKYHVRNYMMQLKSWLLLFALGLAFQSSFAQDSKGTEFWICVPGNQGSPNPQLYITSEAASTVTINIPGIGFNHVVNVLPGTLQTVNLPGSAQVQSQFAVDNKGIHITATNEVTVYCMNAQSATTDAFLAFPLDAVGTQYYVLGYNRDFSFQIPTQATIVATQNNTTVTIISSVTDGGFTAGVPSNITLQQGQVYQLRSLVPNADYSGTKITADKPVGVFGGAQCTNISGNLRACDHLVEQLPPITAWGRSFVTVPLATRRAGDVFRFLAQNNNTQVSVNGTLVATLNAGQFHEMILASSSFNRISSNEPILVGQYSRSSEADNVVSDPFFSLVPPDEQFLNTYIVSAGTSNIPNNYLNITSPTANTNTVMVDGVMVNPAAWTPIPGTPFSGARVQVPNGIHTVSSSLPIGLLVYGFGSFDSYGYLGGQSFSAVATVSTVELTPETGSASVGTMQCFNALVKDQFGNVVTGVRVDFVVTGSNSTAGFAFTNASGVAQFCYTGANAGGDNIVASVGSISDNSTFTWNTVSGNVYYSKSSGDLHNELTWGINPDGSGTNPTDFGTGKTFMLANRPGVYTMTADWTVGGIINIPGSSQLQINGHTLSLTDLAGAGTISGSSTSNLVVIGSDGGNVNLNFTPGNNMLNNLTIDRSGSGAAATLVSQLDLLNVLTLTTGTLNTGNMLTLKSTASNTARVAPVTGAVMGDVTVERFIPSRRAWRILAAPVGGNQTINQAWQEGAILGHSANPNPFPGYGTHITGGPTFGTVDNGFDQNPVGAASSIKSYISNTWQPLPNTNATAVNSAAFMTFIRGDRGINLSYNDIPSTNTTLRSRGPLKVGDQMFSVNATGFTAIPNPFASPINFATITRNGVQNNFYVWDPKMGGANGVGAYVLISFNGSTYDVTPASVSPMSQYIQSGQGFLVRPTTSGVAGSIIIKESDKSATPAMDVFRVNNTNNNQPVFSDPKKGQGLRINLRVVNNDGTTAVLDEAFSSYKSTYAEKIDDLDAVKLDNVEENLGIVREGQTLMLERKPLPQESDVIALKLWNVQPKNYVLELNPIDLAATGLTAYVEDKYLKTSAALALDRQAQIPFTVNSDPGSSRSDRFQIVLSRRAPNSITSISDRSFISAYPNPIDGVNINLSFENKAKGVYQVVLINSVGQVVYRKNVQHLGGTAVQNLQLNQKLPKGVYQLQIQDKEGSTSLTITSN